MTRRSLGIILFVGMVLLLVVGVVGYGVWRYYYWLPDNVADRFLKSYAVYDWPAMASNAAESFVERWKDYYQPIYEAYADLRSRIAEGKGLPVSAVDSPIEMEIPLVKYWNVADTASLRIYTYTGTIAVAFPGSPTHSFSKIDIRVDWRISVDKKLRRVVSFDRRSSTPDWAVFRFLEARMTLNEKYVRDAVCPNSVGKSLDHYLGEYAVDIANLQANIHWIVSHIASLMVDGDVSTVYYGLWKVGGVDSPESIPKWLYIPVKETDTLCNVGGVWYIKDIMFEQQSH